MVLNKTDNNKEYRDAKKKILSVGWKRRKSSSTWVMSKATFSGKVFEFFRGIL